MTYQPPFTITAKTLNLIASISEQLGRLLVLNNWMQFFTPQAGPQDTPQVDNQVVAEILQKQPGLVNFCQTPRSRSELQALCGLKDREHFRKSILKPLLEAGWLNPTLPDKPNSPKQKYICEKAQ